MQSFYSCLRCLISHSLWSFHMGHSIPSFPFLQSFPLKSCPPNEKRPPDACSHNRTTLATPPDSSCSFLASMLISTRRVAQADDAGLS